MSPTRFVRPASLVILILALNATLMPLIPPATGQEKSPKTWTNGTGNGKWSDPANWNPPGEPPTAPGPSNDVTVGVAGGALEMDAGAVTVNSLSNSGVIRGKEGGPNRNVTITAVKNINNIAPGSITGGNGAGSPGIAEPGGWVKLNAGTTLTNSGTLRGGQGGAGGTQNGDGGDVEEKSGGDMTNKDGVAEGGAPGGDGAKKGKPRKEAGGKITMNDGSSVTGYAVAIIAADSVVGQDLAAGAINATSTILITACPSGVIDLRANPNGENVLVAGGSITLRGSPILLDGGVTLAGISSPDATGTTCATPGLDPTGLLVLALIISSAGALALTRRRAGLQS